MRLPWLPSVLLVEFHLLQLDLGNLLWHWIMVVQDPHQNLPLSRVMFQRNVSWKVSGISARLPILAVSAKLSSNWFSLGYHGQFLSAHKAPENVDFSVYYLKYTSKILMDWNNFVHSDLENVSHVSLCHWQATMYLDGNPVILK